mgnify:CR=1 FL=1
MKLFEKVPLPLRRAAIYGLCGGTGVAADYSVFLTALALGQSYQIGNIAGYLSGTVLSFFLHRKFTFNLQDKSWQRFAIFLGVAASGLLMSSGMLWVLVELSNWPVEPSKALTIVVVVLFQFAMNSLITFRTQSAGQGSSGIKGQGQL